MRYLITTYMSNISQTIFYTAYTSFFYKRFPYIRQRVSAERPHNVNDLLLLDKLSQTVRVYSIICHRICQ